MPVILVAEQDASNAERIRDALLPSGLPVEIVSSYAEALNRAENLSPRLLLASSRLPEAPALLAAFARHRGGPGAIVILPGADAPGTSAADFEADEILTEPYSDKDLRQLVERSLNTASEQTAPRSSESSEQLTSADIFGDVLAEVEAEAAGDSLAPRAKGSTSAEDIERRLEETLSGVLPTLGKARRPRKRQPEPPGDAAINELLDQTLSSLDITTRKTGRPAKPRSPQPAAEGATGAARFGKPIEIEGPPDIELPPEFEALPELETVSEIDSPPDAETHFENTRPSAEESAGEPPPEALDPVADPLPAPAADLPEPVLDSPGSNSRGFSSAPEPGTSLPASSMASLDVLQTPGDQFRTQSLPTLPLGKAESAGEDFGDYTLLDRIAIGGMAEVWRARRRGVEGFQKTVAIKKILSHLTGSSDFVTMFIDEAKLAAQLTHNNIIQIYDLGKVGEDFFIAMEYVDGKDLRSILTAAEESHRPVPPGLGLFIVSAVARALDYAHRKRDFDHRALGLVHRDVSPQNVLISYEGEIKLCDFGIVKAVAKASTTQMGALKGKLQYMSPEQAWGKSVDARSDIFSLGSVLYEVLTGTKLFTGESEIGVLDAVRECQVLSPRGLVSEVPEDVERIMLKALAKNPEKRYQTAGEMEHEIKVVLDNLKPTPSQKDLTEYLHTLFTPPAVAGIGVPPAVSEPLPAISEAPVAGPVEATSGQVSKPASVEPESGGGRGLKWIVAAIIVGLLIGAGLLLLRSQKEEELSPAVTAPVPPPVEETAMPSTPDAEETAVAPATESTAEKMDIEQMVNEELTSRAERLRRDFEAEKKRIEKELAKARAAAEDDRGRGDTENPETEGGG